MPASLRPAVALSLAIAAGTVACAPSADPASNESNITSEPDSGFDPAPSCWSPEQGAYYGEVDLRDHAHPRYRIRHNGVPPFYEKADRGKQNINLYFRDGSSWRSPDDLVSKFGRTYGPTIEAESDKTVPWSDLPIPADILEKAFSVKDGQYALDHVEFVFHFTAASDEERGCKSPFYP